jgi:hypothetical protein
VTTIGTGTGTTVVRKPSITKGIETARIVEAVADGDLDPVQADLVERLDERAELVEAEEELDEDTEQEEVADIPSLDQAVRDTTLDDLDSDAEYEGDLEEESEPCPEGERLDQETGTDVLGRRTQLRPSLEVSRVGGEFLVDVPPLAVPGPIRDEMLRELGHYLVEHFAEVFSEQDADEAGQRLHALARQHQQSAFVTHLAGTWAGPRTAPGKDLVSRLLRNHCARVPGLGPVPLHDFFAGDAAAARRADPAALEIARQSFANEPGLTDVQVAERLTSRLGGRWSPDQVARLRKQLDIPGRGKRLERERL